MAKNDQKKPKAPLRRIVSSEHQSRPGCPCWLVDLECGHRIYLRSRPGARTRCYACHAEAEQRAREERKARVKAACARLRVACVPAHGVHYMITEFELLDLAERLAPQ